jgi:hypothetical protein
MSLAGGDFYTGIEEGEPARIWNRYIHRRCTPQFAGKSLVSFVDADGAKKIQAELLALGFKTTIVNS